MGLHLLLCGYECVFLLMCFCMLAFLFMCFYVCLCNCMRFCVLVSVFVCLYDICVFVFFFAFWNVCFFFFSRLFVCLYMCLCVWDANKRLLIGADHSMMPDNDAASFLLIPADLRYRNLWPDSLPWIFYPGAQHSSSSISPLLKLGCLSEKEKACITYIDWVLKAWSLKSIEVELILSLVGSQEEDAKLLNLGLPKGLSSTILICVRPLLPMHVRPLSLPVHCREGGLAT